MILLQGPAGVVGPPGKQGVTGSQGSPGNTGIQVCDDRKDNQVLVTISCVPGSARFSRSTRRKG